MAMKINEIDANKIKYYKRQCEVNAMTLSCAANKKILTSLVKNTLKNK